MNVTEIWLNHRTTSAWHIVIGIDIDTYVRVRHPSIHPSININMMSLVYHTLTHNKFYLSFRSPKLNIYRVHHFEIAIKFASKMLNIHFTIAAEFFFHFSHRANLDYQLMNILFCYASRYVHSTIHITCIFDHTFSHFSSLGECECEWATVQILDIWCIHLKYYVAAVLYRQFHFHEID